VTVPKVEVNVGGGLSSELEKWELVVCGKCVLGWFEEAKAW